MTCVCFSQLILCQDDMIIVLRTLNENLSEKSETAQPPALLPATDRSSDSVSNKGSQGSGTVEPANSKLSWQSVIYQQLAKILAYFIDLHSIVHVLRTFLFICPELSFIYFLKSFLFIYFFCLFGIFIITIKSFKSLREIWKCEKYFKSSL